MATMPKIPITRDKSVNYTELCKIFHENPIKANNEENTRLKEEQLERFRKFYQIDVRQKKKNTVYTIRRKYTKKELDFFLRRMLRRKKEEL